MGNVQLMNYFYDPNLTYSGTTVTLEGPYGRQQTITGESGAYHFSNLGNGTYELKIARDGYGTFKKFGIQIFGTDTLTFWDQLYTTFGHVPPPKLLSGHPDTGYSPEVMVITSDLQYPITGGNIYFYDLIFFISEHDDVSFKNYKLAVQGIHDDRSGTVTFGFNYKNTVGFTLYSGQTYYLKGYVFNPYTYPAYYWDPYLGINVYPTMNDKQGTNTLSIVIP
jgi:hypothetical protein